ncbi:hypothetical protein ABW19_dt0207149 [Dactylella cylindrospora]|nr:hypothetical protein ABW19_dt0207149 [Dactylella cylindrospora]
MGIQKPQAAYFPPTPPPSSPPLHSTTNGYYTNHIQLQTPQSQQDHKSPLLQRIIPYFSPIYSYLATPAATPPPSSLASTEGELDTDFDMPMPPPFPFSASATTRGAAIRHPLLESDISFFSSEASSLASFTGEHYNREQAQIGLRSARRQAKGQQRKRGKEDQQKGKKRKIPSCYEHNHRFPDEEASPDVVPCDWVRPRNSQRFNNYTNADVQCGVPKCENCIADETYGPLSVWQRSAPEGFDAEAHRLRSRVRYLCNRCPQPAAQPLGGVGPIEQCTCVLRDHEGIPTDLYFQCSDCAEACWFEHDSKFGGPEGVLVKRRARRRKNKYGIVVRPRSGKGWKVKRCVCGRIVPSDAKYGVWCTWCHCPVVGKTAIELGGAATRSGKAFVVDPKANDDSEDEAQGEEDAIDSDEEMEDVEEADSGIEM